MYDPSRETTMCPLIAVVAIVYAFPGLLMAVVKLFGG